MTWHQLRRCQCIIGVVGARGCENFKTYPDNSHDELKLTSVGQLIDVIGVVTEPRALSIDVVGVGQGRGRDGRKSSHGCGQRM